MLTVATFNILGPAWAHTKWYESFNINRDLLSNDHRFQKIATTILDCINKYNVSLFSLCEVQTTFIKFLYKFLNPKEWGYFYVSHDKEYWSDQYISLDDEQKMCPWTSDYMDHGVAILYKIDQFRDNEFIDLTLYNKGNHSARMIGEHISGKRIRFTSIHLDSDDSIVRTGEFDSLLQSIYSNNDFVDIIAGDFNFDITNHKYRDILLHNRLEYYDITDTKYTYACIEDTSDQYYVDHILVKNSKNIISHIHDCGIKITKNLMRDCLEILGSDHLPVISKIYL